MRVQLHARAARDKALEGSEMEEKNNKSRRARGRRERELQTLRSLVYNGEESWPFFFFIVFLHVFLYRALDARAHASSYLYFRQVFLNRPGPCVVLLFITLLHRAVQPPRDIKRVKKESGTDGQSARLAAAGNFFMTSLFVVDRNR